MTEFVSAKDPNISSGQELIIQTAWPHIVGRVRKFNATQTSEDLRQVWAQRIEAGAPIVASDTHRLYIELAGTLQDVSKEKIEKAKHESIESYVWDILHRMAKYATANLREGQKYALAWERDIVPDDYYDIQRKRRKQNNNETI
ncbi:MAG: hypothetical protein IJ557_02330 [Bacteroidaceae bacterium]|nr:hypothetical protein [Bacteroidaceae bacterium]